MTAMNATKTIAEFVSLSGYVCLYTYPKNRYLTIAPI